MRHLEQEVQLDLIAAAVAGGVAAAVRAAAQPEGGVRLGAALVHHVRDDRQDAARQPPAAGMWANGARSAIFAASLKIGSPGPGYWSAPRLVQILLATLVQQRARRGRAEPDCLTMRNA